MSKSMIINLFIRGISASLKLFFLLYVAKYNGNQFVGEYSLIMSVSAIAIIALGFEIHSSFGRIIHNVPDSSQIEFVGSQLKFYFSIYILAVPLLYVISVFYIKVSLILAFILSICICLDHFTLELFRILITKLKTRDAIVFNFVKNAPFIIILIVLDFLKIIPISIFSFCLSWLLSNIFSIFFLFNQKKLKLVLPNFRDIYKYKFDNFFILAIDSKFYFLIAILGSITSNFDKIILSVTIGLDKLGVYFALITFGGIMNIFLSYTIGMHQGPQIVRDFALHGYGYYKQKRLALFWDYLVYCLLSSLAILIGFHVLNFFNYTNYSRYTLEFLFVLSSIFIQAISEVFKMDIYLAKFDKVLFKTNLYILFIALLNLYLFSLKFGIIGATIAFFLNAIIQLIIYMYYSKKALIFLNS